ncbi:MAG: hypothetical protein JNJ83_05170 [Verrucomicrobiaceae bacterium]|nr:hypothetical protein [Verrucomicrobiaceae bacterium]
MTRRTKILCTLGPATQTPEVIRELIAKGLDEVSGDVTGANPRHFVSRPLSCVL